MMGAKKKSLAVVVADEVEKMRPEDRTLVLVWSQSAKQIVEDQGLSKTQKLEQLRALDTRKVVVILFETIAKRMKITLWDDRGWGARLALSGLALGTAVAGTKAAGIAALGSAVGVPFFLLTSAGGALLGTIIEEIRKRDKQE